jgi:23S rRNA (uridine2552-2'-O)-methyltransferase
MVSKGKSNVGNSWMREHVNDHYVHQAKAKGYRSRAAFKLLQIDEKDRLIAPGMVVVDLGAAPGSWSQVVAARAGAKGMVIALDLLPMEPIKDVEFIQGDFREELPLRQLRECLAGRKVDLVLSDMAPNISGIASSDQARSRDLCELALEFAKEALKPGGALLIKAFQGSGYVEFLAEMRKSFREVVSRKPDASRGRSPEMYLLGKGYWVEQ